MLDSYLNLAIKAALDAGKVILPFYRKKIHIDHKTDGSPLTLADKAAHDSVVASLADSGIPVVSEEGRAMYMAAHCYWLVDPLDGTKDFLAGNNEFTVNIALIKDCQPILGVVYAPALDELYAGSVKKPAFRVHAGVVTECSIFGRSENLRVAISRFHDHPDVNVFAASNYAQTLIPMGSALKYGRLAFAEVDVFPRLVGSSEWDTAAGQAVLQSVGGLVLDWHTGSVLAYGKPLRRNPRLISMRTPYCYADFKLNYYEPELL